MGSYFVDNDGVKIECYAEGEGPAILCVHGFPESWYSWRHQMAFFSAKGYRVIAMNQRGYGKSSAPEAINAYSLKNLASDVVAVAYDAGAQDRPIFLFGHDWGAPTAYTSVQLYPDLFRGVAGLSVPFTPIRENSTLELWEEIYKERFFYQLYFQNEGIAESELEADIEVSLRKIYYTASGNLRKEESPATLRKIALRGPDSSMLQGLPNPDPFPDWLSIVDLRKFVECFAQGGFRGPLNRYRAQRLDPAELVQIKDKNLSHPSCFIGGEYDGVRNFVPGYDIYEHADKYCDDFRHKTVIKAVGHWVQQEAPQATNDSLLRFVQEVS